MSCHIERILKEEIEQYLNACGLLKTLNVFRKELKEKFLENNDDDLTYKKNISSIAKRYFESQAEVNKILSKIYSARKKLAASSKKLRKLDVKLKDIVSVRSKLIKHNLQLLDELEAKITLPYSLDYNESSVVSKIGNVGLNSLSSPTHLIKNELPDWLLDICDSKKQNNYDLLNSASDHRIKCSNSYAESCNSSLFSDFQIISDEELKNIYPLSSTISLTSDKTDFCKTRHNTKISNENDLRSFGDETNSSYQIITHESLKNIDPLSSSISLSSSKKEFRTTRHQERILNENPLKNFAREINRSCTENENKFGMTSRKNRLQVPENTNKHKIFFPESTSSPCICFDDSSQRKRYSTEPHDAVAKSEKVDLNKWRNFFEDAYDDLEESSHFSDLNSGRRSVIDSAFSSDITLHENINTTSSRRNCREGTSFVDIESDPSSYNCFTTKSRLPRRNSVLHKSSSREFLKKHFVSKDKRKNNRKTNEKYLEISNKRSVPDSYQSFDGSNNENSNNAWKKPTSFEFKEKFNNIYKRDFKLTTNLNNVSILNPYEKTDASYDQQVKERKSLKQYLLENEKEIFDKMDCNMPVELKPPFWKDKVKEYQNDISSNDQEQVQNRGDLGFTRIIQSKSRPKMFHGKETDEFSRCKKDILPVSDSFLDKGNDVAKQRAEPNLSYNSCFSEIRVISDEELKNTQPCSSLVSLSSIDLCKNNREKNRSMSYERKMKKSHSKEEIISIQQKIEDIRITLSETCLNKSQTRQYQDVFCAGMEKPVYSKDGYCYDSEELSNDLEIIGESYSYSSLRFLNRSSTPCDIRQYETEAEFNKSI